MLRPRNVSCCAVFNVWPSRLPAASWHRPGTAGAVLVSSALRRRRGTDETAAACAGDFWRKRLLGEGAGGSALLASLLALAPLLTACGHRPGAVGLVTAACCLHLPRLVAPLLRCLGGAAAASVVPPAEAAFASVARSSLLLERCAYNTAALLWHPWNTVYDRFLRRCELSLARIFAQILGSPKQCLC